MSARAPKGSSQLRGQASDRGRHNNRRGRPRGRSSSIQDRDDYKVWGKAPNPGTDQSSMTRLFEMQKQLNAALRRQARLTKLEVPEVRSAQAEQLRRVNEAILHGSSSALGVKNPFAERNLTDVQLLAEDMVKRQGKKVIEGASMPVPPRPKPHVTKLRLSKGRARVEHSPTPPSLESVFTLRGPLARYYKRAVERGYGGKPEAWLRGAPAAKIASKLSEKGFSFPNPDQWSTVDFRSPMHWVVNAHSGIIESRRTGFQSERLKSKPTNFVVLRDQASAAQRLPRKSWPRTSSGVGLWPNYPTLNESWTMATRKKLPCHIAYPCDTKLLSAVRQSAKQVTPAVAAKTIDRFVIGIRADVEIPRKFLAYFRYRWGFLILRRFHVLPRLLVKRLAQVWKEDISAMWLRCPVRFNEALRRGPTFWYYQKVKFVPSSEPPKTSNTSRQRAGRNTRHRSRDVVSTSNTLIASTPSSDKSDGGVRLC
jgi:hypothetical protein